MNNVTRCRLAGSNQDSSLGHGEEEVDAEEKLTVATNRRLGYSYRAETSDCRCPCPSPSYEGHWCEEDRLFPLKKRRAIFTSTVGAGMAADKEQESVKEPTRITEKSQRTWVKRFDYPENEEEQENNEAKKKLSAGGGKIQVVNSLCSRNSGRGWRCNRPAVVGHARCEYHLSRAKRFDYRENDQEEQENNEAKKKLSGGGGKIQAVNSRCSRNSGRGWRCNRPAVLGHARCEYHLSRANAHNLSRRNRHKNNISLKKVYPSLLYSEEEEDEGNGKGFDKRSVGKARSISSLLDQTAPIRTSTSGR